jgi:ribosome recycling factor
MPELSQERRNELIKHLKKIAEMYRIEVRNERDIYNKDIEDKEKDNEISEDDKYRLKESIQKETQNVNNEIEKSVEEKIEKIKL